MTQCGIIVNCTNNASMLKDRSERVAQVNLTQCPGSHTYYGRIVNILSDYDIHLLPKPG